MALFKKRGKWYIDYYYQGRRIRECVGPSKRMAEQALAARKGEIVQGRFKIEEVKVTPLLEDFARQYLAWAEVNHRGYRRSTLPRVGNFVSFFHGKRLHEITPWLIEKYKAERREKVKASTVNRELSIMSCLFSKAVEWGYLRDHPMKGGKVKRLREESVPERILTLEEEKRLLENSPPGLQDLLVIALDTGLRLGELVGLKRESVDLGQRHITVRNTKNGRNRRVPLTARAFDVLKRRVDKLTQGANIFPPGPGERPWWIDSAFGRAVCRSGLYGLRFHDLRHTFATRLVTRGVDLATVQRLLGHQQIQMTLRYSHPTSDDMRRAVKVLETVTKDGHQMDTKGKIERRVVSLSS